MSATRPRRFTRLIPTLALSLVLPACATKVITLAVDGGAGGTGGPDARFPAPFCIDFTDATTAAACVTCYDNAGTQITMNCVASTVGQMCGVTDDPMLGRCVQCMGGTGTPVIRACLKCDAPQGDCMACSWSDRPTDQCQICTPPVMGTVMDTCNQLRPELR